MESSQNPKGWRLHLSWWPCGWKPGAVGPGGTWVPGAPKIPWKNPGVIIFHPRFSCHSTYSEGQPSQKRKVFQHNRTRRWFFQTCLFHPYLEKWSDLTTMLQMGLKSSTRFSQIIGPQHHPKNDLFIGWRKEWWFANGVHHRAWMLVFGAMIRSFLGWWSSVPRGLKTARTCPVPLAILPTRRTKPARHDRGHEVSYAATGGTENSATNSLSRWPTWKNFWRLHI